MGQQALTELLLSPQALSFWKVMKGRSCSQTVHKQEERDMLKQMRLGGEPNKGMLTFFYGHKGGKPNPAQRDSLRK